MLRGLLPAIVCVLGMHVPAVAWAKDFRLAPSSDWAVEAGPDSCQLWRKFGTGDDKVYAQLFRYEPSSGFDLTLIGKPLGEPEPHQTVRLLFGTAGAPVQSRGLGGTAAGELPVLFLSGRLDNLDPRNLGLAGLTKLPVSGLRQVEAVDPAVEAAVTEATVEVGRRKVTLELGSMGPPMEAMRKCTTELVKGWGLDPAEQQALLRPVAPKSNPGEWLLPSDYPAWAALWGHQAIVRFRLMIDDTGKVTACTVQSAIAKGPFAAITCELLRQRASFEPARSADGRAVPSYFANKVVWMLR